MSSNDYLDRVLRACAREQAEAGTLAGSSADVIVDKEFRSIHADLCDNLTRVQAERLRARAEVDRLFLKGPFARLLGRSARRRAEDALARREREEAEANARIDAARRAFDAEPANRKRLADLQLQVHKASCRHSAAQHIAKRAAGLTAALGYHKSRFPGALLSMSFPGRQSHDDDDVVVSEAAAILERVEIELDESTHILEQIRGPAMKAATILSEFIKDDRRARRPTPRAVEQRSRASLGILTRRAEWPSLADQLRACSWPNYFHRRADWLVLWSALRAGVKYNELADGNAANEGVKAGWWCGEWQKAIAQWDQSTLRALARRWPRRWRPAWATATPVLAPSTRLSIGRKRTR